MRALFTSFLATLLLAAPLRAQQTPAPPSIPGSRIIRTFNFEERPLGNYEATPMYWAKVEGRGFPGYSVGAFDRSGNARSADTAFTLETSGGSVAYRFTPPPDKRIPIHPDADYYILAFVKTENLKYARADLAAWFADENGNLLPGTELHSSPYTPATTSTNKSEDPWRVLYIHVPGPTAPPGADHAGSPPRAQSLVLQLGLLQPQQLGGGATGNSGLGKFEIYQQDIQGRAIFDDITVFQLPRVSIAVPDGIVGNLFTGTQKVRLDLVVSDLGVDSPNLAKPSPSLDVRLKITDPDGLVLVSEKYPVTVPPDRAWSLNYTHAPLPAGLYTATLEVCDSTPNTAGKSANASDAGTLIAKRQTQFLCLPLGDPGTRTNSRPAPEFGLGLDTRTTRAGASDFLTDLPTMLRYSGAGLVQLPLWRRDTTEDALTRRDAQLDALLATLQRSGIRSIATFSAIPATLARRLPPKALNTADGESDSILTLLNADPALWRPYVSFALTRYANRIDAWELGAPDMPFSGNATPSKAPLFDLPDRYARLYDRTYSEVVSLLNKPQLIIPWNALFDFDAKQYPGARLDLRLPSIIKPQQLPAYLDNFRQQAGGTTPSLFAHIEPLERAQYPHAQRLADFAQRLVFARSANPDGILYDLGTDSANSARETALPPDELFLVYRTFINALGNSAFAGQLAISPGIRAFLFNKNGSGTLVLWNESAPSAEITLDLPLGATPRLTDLLGNQHDISPDPASGLTHLAITSTPVILDRLDPRPLQLKTSYALATPTVPAGVGSVKTEVLLKNPYSDVLSGTLRIMPPKGWAADPATISVSIPPGAAYRRPITLRYPFTENVGPREVGGRLNLDQTTSFNAQQLELSFPIAVTSDLVELDGFTQLQENGDITIQQMITNISDRPLDAQAYTLLPGYPQQKRYVSSLPPGQTVVKRFTFPANSWVPGNGSKSSPSKPTAADIVRAMVGQTATLGLRQTDGKTLLTKSIPLE